MITFRNDRGIVPVIGLMLVLAIVMLAATTYENTTVPESISQEENTHLQDVKGDFISLKSAIRKSSSTGNLQSQRIRLGMEYNTPMIVDRISPRGSLYAQKSNKNIVIKNVENNGVASNYWSGNGDARTYPTDFIRYEVQYNRLTDSPAIQYEYGVAYLNYTAGQPPRDELEKDNYIILQDTRLVNDRNINLYTITSNISVSSSSAATVQAYPVSAPSNTLPVSDNGSVSNSNKNIRISLPTRIPVSVWKDKILKEEIENGFIKTITDNAGSIEIVLDSTESYNLRMSRIHLTARGQRAEVPTVEPKYVAWAGGGQRNIKEDSVSTIRAQARDSYNNGVIGTEVRAEGKYDNGDCAGDFRNTNPSSKDDTKTCTNSGNFDQPGSQISSANGDAFFVYNSPSTGSDKQLTFSVYLGD
jgi:hypothetical protein